jgi:hypothetical protein
MQVDRRLLDWGVFLIVLGAVPLAVQAGVLDRTVLADVGRLWPLVIVGIGVGLILRATPAAVFGGLIVAVVLGLIGGSVLAGSGLDFGALGCGGRTTGPAFAAREGSFEGPTARVTIEASCVDLTVAKSSGSGWTVGGTAATDRAPEVTADTGRLTIRSGRRTFDFLTFADRGHDAWQVGLPGGPTIGLDATVNAGSARLDLGGLTVATATIQGNAGSVAVLLAGSTVQTVDLTINAGSATVDLPNASLTGSLTVNAGSIGFCAPAGVGLRLTTSENLTGSNDFADHGLSKAGSTWTNAAWATAAAKIDLAATANAGSLNLNPEEGCR